MADDTCPCPDHHDDRCSFPGTLFAHETPGDPLCAAGLERNARDLRVAVLACPSGPADVEDHLARIAPRLGITHAAGLDYCDIGLMLDRLTDLGDLLEQRPFLPLSHVRMIARAVIPLDDEHLEAFTDRLLRYLAPKRHGQALVGYRSLASELSRIIGDLQPMARPPDPDDEPVPDPATGADFDIDDRSPRYTLWHIGMRADLAREALAIVDAIAAAHHCSRNDALLHALRGTAAGVKVTFNLYRDVAGGPAWMSGPGWLDAVATDEWVARITGLRIASHGDTEGYAPTEAMVAFLEGRDGVCRFPGCNSPAHRGDKDHVAAFDANDPANGGPTDTKNMHCLCRRHHNVKTSKLWDIELHPDGDEVWTSADGEHRFSTVPQGPLAGFGRQTFDARVTRLTGARAEHNRRRMAAEEAANARTEKAREEAVDLWPKLYGPDADGTDPETGLPIKDKEKQAKYPEVPPF
ncbi:HNH endonuclease signature motif containing protein [Corynebacterium sp. NPDC060344]|uniref:HNH endonuclease signature motif containing protein n=1 Tax=Corynebacterium sp. NPDC060344 TaxID=3347101 RepID=UPI00365642CD